MVLLDTNRVIFEGQGHRSKFTGITPYHGHRRRTLLKWWVRPRVRAF